MTDTQTPGQLTEADIARFKRNLKEETDGIALYRSLAEVEGDGPLHDIYVQLAASEERHKALWERKLREAGVEPPVYKVSRKTRFIGWLARRFGTEAVAPLVSSMETGAVHMYDDQPEAVAENLPRDERSHAKIFREIGRGYRQPETSTIARIEGRHRGLSGNAIRAAVLGANDGLVSNLILVMGVAGASPGRSVVLLAGLTGLLAGAFSMALGEWISVRSSHEAYQRQISIERDELQYMPEEEREELALIYQAKGFTRDEAKALADRLMSNPDTALQTLVREELGMSEEEGGNAWVAAITSFVLFSVGAFVPIAPWLFIGGAVGIALSTVLAGLALFAAGAVTTLFTGRGVLFSGGRMLVFGLLGAAITFGIGSLVGGVTNV